MIKLTFIDFAHDDHVSKVFYAESEFDTWSEG